MKDKDVANASFKKFFLTSYVPAASRISWYSNLVKTNEYNKYA